MEQFLKNLLVLSVCSILAFGFPAQMAFGQETQPATTPAVAVPTDSQANSYINGNNPEESEGIDWSALGAEEGVSGCISAVVGGYISQALGAAFKFAAPETWHEVPDRSNTDVGSTGSLEGGPPSLDSIGYCIINGIIEHITQATIDWINSGFDGNPAFVSNPEQFFKDIVSVETASFLQEVVGGATGINICEPFRLQIVTGIANELNGGYGADSRCKLEDIQAAMANSGVDFDYNEYTAGNSPDAGNLEIWRTMTQDDASNFYGAFFLSQRELDRRLEVKNNTATLDLSMGKGFLSFRKCEDPVVVTNPDGTTTTQKPVCKITTPGTLIESKINTRLAAGDNRLVLADKFDQIITALVNQLIKVALNEMLGSGEDQMAI